MNSEDPVQSVLFDHGLHNSPEEILDNLDSSGEKRRQWSVPLDAQADHVCDKVFFTEHDTYVSHGSVDYTDQHHEKRCLANMWTFRKGTDQRTTTHKLSLLYIDIFFSIQWFLKRTTKAQISLHKCSGWSGPSLSAYTLKAHFFTVLLFCNEDYRLGLGQQRYFAYATGEDPDQPVS